MAASEKGKLEIVKYLHENGADLNVKNKASIQYGVTMSLVVHPLTSPIFDKNIDWTNSSNVCKYLRSPRYC